MCLFSTGRQQYVVMKNCNTFCNTAECVYRLQWPYIRSWRTASLQYCRMCLPSVVAILCSRGKRQQNTAECADLSVRTEYRPAGLNRSDIAKCAVPFVRTTYSLAGLNSWDTAEFVVPFVRTICRPAGLNSWDTAECVVPFVRTEYRPERLNSWDTAECTVTVCQNRISSWVTK